MPSWSSPRAPIRNRSCNAWWRRGRGCRSSSCKRRPCTRSSSTWSARMPREPRRDRMRKVWVVIRREFVERIRRRWFWVMALLGPLFFAAVFVLPTVLASRGGVRQIVVVDATTGPVGARITHLLNDSPMFRARRVPASGKVVDSLTTEVEQKRLAGFLIVTDAAADSGKAEYRGSNASGFATVGALERTIGDVVSAVRLEPGGGDPRVGARARIPVRIDTKKSAGGKTTGETAAQSFSLAYFMGIILYTAILLYGINVMSSVLEEKTRSEEHTSELQSRLHLVCRLLLEKKKDKRWY